MPTLIGFAMWMMRETPREELVRSWIDFCARVVEAETAAKSSQFGILRILDLYGSLSPSERVVFNQLLLENLESRDDALVFQPLAVISEFQIRDALPALRGRERALKNAKWPQAAAARNHIARIISELMEAK